MAKLEGPEAERAEHVAYVTQLRNSHFHIGTTPDGAWGLFCPQTRRVERRWLDLPVVWYNATEMSRYYLAHDGEKFGTSWLYRKIEGAYQPSLQEWNAKLRIMYPQLPALRPPLPDAVPSDEAIIDVDKRTLDARHEASGERSWWRRLLRLS